MTAYVPYSLYCEKLKQANRLRALPGAPAEASRKVLDFSSNDYLQLSRHEAVLEAARAAVTSFGVGATGARLLSGNCSLFRDFERQIAHDKHTEAALLFISGYQANSTVLPALLDSKVLGKKPLCFFDRLNHASLYHGLLLSQAEFVRYRHLDMDHLQELLHAPQAEGRPKFIITETVFSMDGDRIDPHRLKRVAQEAEAFVYLDEAHATGLFGPQGYGLSTLCDWKEVPHLIMGTLDKAVGVSGAYVATTTILCDYLMNHCTGFIYSTAPSPLVIGAAAKAWALIPSLHREREALLARAARVRHGLQEAGWDTRGSSTQIVPLVIGEEGKTIALREKLQEEAILVSAVRPPTVSPHTSRLRLSVTAAHTEADMDYLLHHLKKLLT